MILHLTLADWLAFAWHLLSISLLAVGGPMTLAPDMHRFFVMQHHWLTDAQFSSSIAIAQAAPGPNLLFVGMLGWNVGLNAAGGLAAGGLTAFALGVGGMVLALASLLLPSGVLVYFASRWAQRNRHLTGVRAFKTGLAPMVVALLLSTGWLLASVYDQPTRDWRLWLLIAASTLLVLRTRVHLLWLIAAGAVLGAAGLV
ncbi:chromate transporter [Brachymonas sp. M4Q-1]|uniref:chromate transporter n=1 Tax=Brachymonas sp. M4Q-1 TaxID=3416906 RepID=UPI003CFBBA72